ncbi:MAG: hypothetical protein JRE10_08910 [Deltaproteobacteria bacterium]|nr:hypothetical protein [Deltaproteobacteria bacterium]
MRTFNEFLDHYLDSVKLTPAFNTFLDATLGFNKLLDIKVGEDLELKYLRMIFSSAVGALESYLSDTFIGLVLDIEEIRKVTLNSPKIFVKKYTIKEISDSEFNLDKEIIKNLSSILWHNLDKVREIYRHSIRIKFPDIPNSLRDAVLKRHDIVHRNGKGIDGEDVSVSEQDVRNLLSEVEMFVFEINEKIIEYKSKTRGSGLHS